MEKKQCISIIIPVLNEQAAIQSLVERIEMTATNHSVVYEIIFVDDHSTDKTQHSIDSLANMYPVRLHIKQGQPGKAQSLLEGFALAQYDIVCMIDGDLQYPPESIPEMMQYIKYYQADIIVGNRKDNRESLKRKIFSKTYRYIFGKLLHQLDCDIQSGLKVFKKDILEHVTLHPSPWTFDLEFLIGARKAGYRIASHDIIFFARPVGTTKVGLLKATMQIGFSALQLKVKLPEVVPRPPQEMPRKKVKPVEISDRGENRKKSDVANRVVIASALLIVSLFAFWWFSPQHIPQNFTGTLHIFDIIIFLLVSYVIWHPLVMEIVTWIISLQIKELPHMRPPYGLKVAFITTIVPKSESLELLHKTLPAMMNAEYPHDTWLLDEGDNPDVKEICRQYGVMHFSRHGDNRFNTPVGKFTKTKGGNHNSWYAVHGKEYDIVAQIDTDFVPKPTFLTDTLGYFRDPRIGFVGTPQVYGNTDNSFIAKGAAEQLYNFYGPILQGLSGMQMTLLLGANHIIRVAALRDIGLYTAHITEDLITGMKLHKNGWKSVYIPYTLAVGEGPFTWEAYFNQQKRWAYGCIDILFHHSPKIFTQMGFRRAIVYFFLQQYYFSGLAMVISLALLNAYFISGIRAANIDLFQFLLIYPQINLILWLISIWLQRFHVSWEKESRLLLAGKIISISAWPIYFLAFLNVLSGKKLRYKVTPKGENEKITNTPLSFFTPHLFFGSIAALGLVISFFTHRQSGIMMFWAFSSAFLMLIIPFTQRISTLSSQLYDQLIAAASYIFSKKSKQLYVTALSDRKTGFFDCLFLCGAVGMSVMLYISKLGFYSDDWAFLGNFTITSNKTLLGLYQTAATPATLMRPMQNIYDSVLYLLFGTQPIGYQIVNAVVFTSIILLLYLILKNIRITRLLALTISLVFAFLPNYTTDRFWYAAFQVNLSLLFFLLSCYSGLKVLSRDAGGKIFWKSVSIVSLMISVLSYEVILPLVLVNFFLFWNPFDRFNTKQHNKVNNNAVFIMLNIIVLLYLVLFKIKTTTRLGSFNYPGNVMHLLMAIFHTNFGIFGIQLPYIWGEIFAKYANTQMLVVGSVIYVCIFLYLFMTTSQETSDFPGQALMRNIMLMGISIFILGYAIFFTNNQVGFSPTGIDNRVAIAATIGIAMTIVGGVGWLCNLFLPKTYAHWFFCVIIAVVCTGGFLVINTLASFWIQASQKQHLVLSDIRHEFPVLPKKSTLIVDGICPYVGPGVVFESQWDLKGALQTIYDDPTIQADVVTPRLKVTSNNIDTQIYTFKAYYPYHNLFIYNERVKKVYPIHSIGAAYSYFQEYNPDFNNGCPPASAGNGVDVF